MVTRRQLLAGAASVPALLSQNKKRNIVFILCDDHRFDYIGALGHPWLKGHTPHLDRLIQNGVHFQNAFVTSSLCSPSRASLLSSLYMHSHKVVDNFTAFSDQLPTFPRLLQQNGYRTAFYGKWHMGGASDAPQRGFDDWLSFKGQGEYNDPEINRNGVRSRKTGYLSDILTQESRRFVKENAARPFCLYLSHKAIHYPFQPPPRHANRFAGMPVPRPDSMPYKKEFYQQLPEWVKRRRYSRHGVDGLFGHATNFDDAYRGYCRSLLAVDESVGEILAQLEDSRLLNDTLVVYMGDNGYMWGEHGLIDKRAAYEPSIRVPMIAHCPDLSGPRKVPQMALNLDIAPTFLEAAGVTVPKSMQGRSLLPLIEGRRPGDWRTDFIYEYEWEQDFPYTPTITALRNERYTFAQYPGVWDIAELYDLQKDPGQMKNLVADLRLTYQRGRLSMNIPDPERQQLIGSLQSRLYDLLVETGGDPRRAGKTSPDDKYAL